VNAVEMEKSALNNFKIEIEQIESTPVKVVYLFGKITSQNSYAINHRIKNIFDDKCYDTILNISEVEYLDSKGVAMLLTLARVIEDNGGRLIVTKPSIFVKELLELTNLQSYFKIVEDLAEARKKFQAPA